MQATVPESVLDPDWEAPMPLRKRLGWILNLVASALVAFVVVTLALGFYLYRLSETLPDLDVDRGRTGTQQTSIVFAADGSVLARWHGDEDRVAVSLEDMPLYLRNAVVSIEDRRFWEHNGVDTEGIVRALRANATAGEVRQGGSTITQQLVKLLFTGGERTFTRKVREALLAYELESKVDKQQVLESYINTVYFGHGAYGVESAARRYFGKRTASLDLADGALLAGIIQSPSRFDPIDHPQAARERRDVVLHEMRMQGYITPDEERDAARRPVQIAPPKEVPAVAPYFVEYVKRDLIERLGAEKVYGGGLRVYTTLDPQLQALAERSATTLKGRDPEVAIVSVRHSDGAVVAMVGGRSFAANQFNLAAQGRRQPGSAFKPFVLVAALEKGVRPTRVYSARPYSVAVKDGIWNVQNYENAKTAPAMTLQAATNWSVNAVYARLIMEVGPEQVVRVAKRLGITTPLNADPAIALGGLRTGVSPLEMASAYGTLANGGLRVRPSGVLKVTNTAGKVLYTPDRTAARVVSRPVAVQASLMLHDVVERGTAQAARIGVWSAGKTGTTQSYRDAWFVGWSSDLSTAVWVGYPKAQIDMTNVHGIKVTGGSFPAQIWAQYMRGASTARSRAVTPAQEGAPTEQVLVRVCEDTMQLANKRCPRTVDIYLAPGLVPKGVCKLH